MRLVLSDPSNPESRTRLRSSLEMVAAADGETDLEVAAPASVEDAVMLLRVSETPMAVIVIPDPLDWLGSLRQVMEAAGAAPVLVLADGLSSPLRLEARRLGATDWIDVSETPPREIWRRVRGADAMVTSLPALHRRLLQEVSRALGRVETALGGWEDRSDQPERRKRRRGPFARLVSLLDGRALHLLLYLAVSVVGIIAAALGFDLMPLPLRPAAETAAETAAEESTEDESTEPEDVPDEIADP